MLNTIVVLPVLNWSKAVIDFYNLFTKSYWFSTHTIWPDFGAINLTEDRLKLCNIYESIQPLAFYKDHLYSTSFEDHMGDFRITRGQLVFCWILTLTRSFTPSRQVFISNIMKFKNHLRSSWSCNGSARRCPSPSFQRR